MQTLLRFAVTVLAAVVITVVTRAASADDKKPEPKAATPKTKVYDFSGDKIEGDLIRPEGSSIDARTFGTHGSLIRIRKDFIPEIVKSAEDL
jgi:hypothetical protein